MKENIFLERITLDTTLGVLIEDVIEAYALGSLLAFDIIPVGFEDCNVHVQTTNGQFLVKIFAQYRTDASIQRYVDVIHHALRVGVRHPVLCKTTSGTYVYNVPRTSPLIVLEYIPGSTFAHLHRGPQEGELHALLEQLARLHASEYKPGYVHDTWSVQNIFSAYERVREYISADDKYVLAPVLDEFSLLELDTFPHAFVHADCTKSNVLLGDDGLMYILDFSVSGYFPKIQDLAVVAANFLHRTGAPLRDRVARVQEAYVAYGTLTDEEKHALYVYAKGAVAMELLGALQEKYLDGNDTPEVAYWYSIVHEGLRNL